MQSLNEVHLMRLDRYKTDAHNKDAFDRLNFLLESGWAIMSTETNATSDNCSVHVCPPGETSGVRLEFGNTPLSISVDARLMNIEQISLRTVAILNAILNGVCFEPCTNGEAPKRRTLGDELGVLMEAK